MNKLWEKDFTKWVNNITYNYVHSDEIRNPEDIRTDITDMIMDLYDTLHYSHRDIWNSVDKYYQDCFYSMITSDIKRDIISVVKDVVYELHLLVQ